MWHFQLGSPSRLSFSLMPKPVCGAAVLGSFWGNPRFVADSELSQDCGHFIRPPKTQAATSPRQPGRDRSWTLTVGVNVSPALAAEGTNPWKGWLLGWVRLGNRDLKRLASALSCEDAEAEMWKPKYVYASTSLFWFSHQDPHRRRGHTHNHPPQILGRVILSLGSENEPNLT